MIYNKEYQRRIREGKNIPREKWVIRQSSREQVLGKWLPAVKPIQLKYGKCIVCGNGIYWNAKKESRNLCSICYCWATAFRKRNKQQLNLFCGI